MSPPKSTVWNNFMKVDKTEAKCKLCNALVKTAGNTSNLWTHLEKKHDIKKQKSSGRGQDSDDRENNSELVDDVEGENDLNGSTAGTLPATVSVLGKRKSSESTGGKTPKQATLSESYERAKSFEAGGRKALELDDAYLYMLMKDNMPLVSGQKDGFMRFCKVGVPLWTPPKRDRTTRMMEDKYNKISALVRNALAQLPSVCLTADNWTEKHSTTSFLGVTVHFAMGTEMESVVLGLKHLDESHTANYLGEQFTEVLNYWNIEMSRVSLCITDNAENIKLCVRQLFGNDRVLGCFDHTLNLIPKAALGYKTVDRVLVPNVPGIPELIKRVKKIVTFSHTSYNFSNEIKRLQYERGETEGTALRLLQDCPTRWGSTYQMLDRFITMSEIVTVAAFKFPSEVEVLTPHQLATLRSIKDFLHPFHEVTKEMGAEKETAASKVIPIVALLRQALEKVNVPNNDELARRFRKFVFDEFDRRFQHIENVKPLAIATLVDPRFKLTYFKNIGATASVRNIVEDMIKRMIRDEARSADEARRNENSDPGTNQPEATGQVNHGAGSLWGDHDAMVAAAHANMTVDDMGGKARTELRAFLHRHPAPRSANPLAVWESIKLEYPYMYKIARQYLPLLATSVPCERAFSNAGRIVNEDTNRLSSEHLHQRLFLFNISDRLWDAA